MPLKEQKKKKTTQKNIFGLHLMALMSDHKILTVLSTVGGRGAAGKQTHIHTLSKVRG